MKTKTILFVIFIILSNSLYSQNVSDSLNINKINFLKLFYFEYFDAACQDLPNLPKLDSLQLNYCTTELYDKLLYLYDLEEIDADPFLESQDPQKEWFKSLNIKADNQDTTLYIVTYKINNQKTNVIKLRVIEVANNSFKISSIVSIEKFHSMTSNIQNKKNEIEKDQKYSLLSKFVDWSVNIKIIGFIIIIITIIFGKCGK